MKSIGSVQEWCTQREQAAVAIQINQTIFNDFETFLNQYTVMFTQVMEDEIDGWSRADSIRIADKLFDKIIDNPTYFSVRSDSGRQRGLIKID
jgi:hypothetical protein